MSSAGRVHGPRRLRAAEWMCAEPTASNAVRAAHPARRAPRPCALPRRPAHAYPSPCRLRTWARSWCRRRTRIRTRSRPSLRRQTFSASRPRESASLSLVRAPRRAARQQGLPPRPGARAFRRGALPACRAPSICGLSGQLRRGEPFAPLRAFGALVLRLRPRTPQAPPRSPSPRCNKKRRHRAHRAAAGADARRLGVLRAEARAHADAGAGGQRHAGHGDRV
jgi:hypothetical protein